jgi:hypothetical protein
MSLSPADLRFFLLEELRIDEKSLKSLDKQKMRAIASVYKNKLVNELVSL